MSGRSRSRDRSRSREAENKGNTLYIANLSYRTDERDLDDAFSKYGKIRNCSLVRDPYTSDSRGFAFITMDSSRDAEEAISRMDGAEFQGRRIRVELSRRALPHTSTPGQSIQRKKANASHDLGPPSASSRSKRRRSPSYGRRRSPSYGRRRSPSYGRRRSPSYGRGRSPPRHRDRDYRDDDRRYSPRRYRSRSRSPYRR